MSQFLIKLKAQEIEQFDRGINDFRTLSYAQWYVLNTHFPASQLYIDQCHETMNEALVKATAEDNNELLASNMIRTSFSNNEKLFIETALFFSYANDKIPNYHENKLTLEEVDKAIKYYSRHLKAQYHFIKAMQLMANVKSYPTAEDVAKEALTKVGLDPDLLYVSIYNFYLLGDKKAYPLWKYYLRSTAATGKYNPVIVPDYPQDSINSRNIGKFKEIYYSMELASKHYKDVTNKFANSQSFDIDKNFEMNYIYARILSDDGVSDEVAMMITEKPETAHYLRAAYYGDSDKALVYQDTSIIDSQRKIYLLQINGIQYDISVFQSLNDFKLALYNNRYFYAPLWTKVEEGDTYRYIYNNFKEYALEDNSVYIWDQARWEQGISLVPINKDYPIKDLVSKEYNSFINTNLNEITDIGSAAKTIVKEIVSYIPVIGQPIDFIWNCVEGNVKELLLNIAFITGEITDDMVSVNNFFSVGKRTVQITRNHTRNISESIHRSWIRNPIRLKDGRYGYLAGPTKSHVFPGMVPTVGDFAKLKANSAAHTIERHGFHITEEALKRRATEGVAPDGSSIAKLQGGRRIGNIIPPMSSKFIDAGSIKKALKAVDESTEVFKEALRISETELGNGETVTQFKFQVDLGETIGLGYKKPVGAPNYILTGQKLSGTPIKVNDLTKIEVRYKLNRTLGKYEINTMFPIE
ncbi:hypothetical protein [Tenacibaculum sp. C7A-26P2]|uniref:hypothetical protein n=1 Tax=Tenacibaculum sp. C7A-26P2 TaxID=3447504 RepID=UPI003F879F43